MGKPNDCFECVNYIQLVSFIKHCTCTWRQLEEFLCAVKKKLQYYIANKTGSTVTVICWEATGAFPVYWKLMGKKINNKNALHDKWPQSQLSTSVDIWTPWMCVRDWTALLLISSYLILPFSCGYVVCTFGLVSSLCSSFVSLCNGL